MWGREHTVIPGAESRSRIFRTETWVREGKMSMVATRGSGCKADDKYVLMFGN